MADIRALMAQERQARRVNHEFATYTKSGVLMCSACQLNVKSETLWEGHLRSANHKTNVKRIHQAPRAVAKRKIEDVDEAQSDEDVDARKKLKPKSRVPSGVEVVAQSETSPLTDRTLREPQDSIPTERIDENVVAVMQPAQPPPTSTHGASVQQTQAVPQVDEDEWAAFEREVVPLTQPDFSGATISAAPVTAAQLEAEAESERRRLRDAEAEDEKEEEGRRMEEEFDLMEEMEERVRKLKEKREALRALGQKEVDTGQLQEEQPVADETSTAQDMTEDHSDDSDDDADDWYS